MMIRYDSYTKEKKVQFEFEMRKKKLLYYIFLSIRFGNFLKGIFIKILAPTVGGPLLHFHINSININ